MSVLQTVLTFVVAPLGLLLLIAASVIPGRGGRRRRYRPGGPWPYPPVLWTADSLGADLPEIQPRPVIRSLAAEALPTVGGGARGSW